MLTIWLIQNTAKMTALVYRRNMGQCSISLHQTLDEKHEPLANESALKNIMQILQEIDYHYIITTSIQLRRNESNVNAFLL